MNDCFEQIVERYRILDLAFHIGQRGTSARHVLSVRPKEGPQFIEHIDPHSVSAQSEQSGHSVIQTAAHGEHTAAQDSKPSLQAYTGQGPSVLNNSQRATGRTGKTFQFTGRCSGHFTGKHRKPSHHHSPKTE